MVAKIKRRMSADAVIAAKWKQGDLEMYALTWWSRTSGMLWRFPFEWRNQGHGSTNAAVKSNAMWVKSGRWEALGRGPWLA